MTNPIVDETFLPPGDYAIRRRALADSFRRKAAHAVRLNALADANGFVSAAALAEAANPTGPPAAT